MDVGFELILSIYFTVCPTFVPSLSLPQSVFLWSSVPFSLFIQPSTSVHLSIHPSLSVCSFISLSLCLFLSYTHTHTHTNPSTWSLSNMMPPLDWIEQISLCLFMAKTKSPSMTSSSFSHGSTSRYELQERVSTRRRLTVPSSFIRDATRYRRLLNI